MINEEDFISWLNNDDRQEPFITNEGDYKNYFLKIPISNQFVYVYRQSCHNGKGIERYTSFNYAGFYNKANEMIYDSNYRFADLSEKHIYKLGVGEIYDKFEDDVRRFIKQTVESNRDYYQSLELSAEGKEELQRYEEHCLAQAARKAYLQGISSEDITYDVRYYCNFSKRNDNALLEIIAGPQKFIQREAEKYLRENEEDIVLERRTAALTKAAVQALELEEDGPIQRIKRIRDAIEKSGAQSVKVTINKDGEEFTFKTSANELARDPFHYYGSYYIAAEDRKLFEQKFGRNSHYTPEEIVDISYRGKSIYSAEPYDPEQSESAGLGIKQG